MASGIVCAPELVPVRRSGDDGRRQAVANRTPAGR